MNKLIIFRNKWFILATIGTLAIVVVLAISLIGLKGGEAADKLERKQAQDKALTEARTIIPESATTTEMPEYDSSNGFGFAVNNSDGDLIAVIVADRVTGEIKFLIDMRAESYSHSSDEVKVDINEATEIAEDFFTGKGVEISEYGLEEDPLHIIAWDTSDMDNPKPIYQYDFYYRIQKDGIFIDDLNNGSGFCSIGISAEDSTILSFTLPRENLSIKDKRIAEINIDKEKAIELAVDYAQIIEERDQVPVLQEKEHEMRYLLSGNTLVPYWTFSVVIYEGSHEVSRVDISISAVDGSVIKEEHF